MLEVVLWGLFYACPWHGVAESSSVPGGMVFCGSCQAVLPSLTLLPHPSHPAPVWNSIDLLFHLTVNGHRPALPIAEQELSYLFIWSVLPSPVLSLPTQTLAARLHLHSFSATSFFLFYYLGSWLFAVRRVECISDSGGDSQYFTVGRKLFYLHLCLLLVFLMVMVIGFYLCQLCFF